MNAWSAPAVEQKLGATCFRYRPAPCMGWCAQVWACHETLRSTAECYANGGKPCIARHLWYSVAIHSDGCKSLTLRAEVSGGNRSIQLSYGRDICSLHAGDEGSNRR